MDFDQDLTLLQTWYKLDTNTLPTVYRLLPVSTHHPEYTILSRDVHRRKLGRKAWRSACVKLWNVLWQSGPEAIGEDATCHMLKTVLDSEVEQGFEGKLINQVLHQAQQRFVRNIHFKLRHTNIHETNISWGRRVLSAKHNRSHQFYIERLCSHVQRAVTAALNSVMQASLAKGSYDVQRRDISRRRVDEEIQHHIKFGITLAHGYVFRQDFLGKVKRTLLESSSLLLLGEPGFGKSRTLAKVAQLIPTWIPGDANVLTCFVGLISDSRNVRLMLQNLCLQLANIYCPKTEISETLPKLSSELCSLLGLVTEDRPLTLVLDGLDNLSEEHESDLSWLCNILQPHVFIILSASTQSKCAHILQSQLKVSVLTLPALNSKEITSGLVSRLASDSHTLTEDQWSLLFQSCLSCPSPLYLNLAYAETRRWCSFTLKDSFNLPMDLQQLFLSILVRLEREHGACLVRRMALLITFPCWRDRGGTFGAVGTR
ncbi:uncharacterized protein LOC130561265 isoform X1 [Triplophysa rosa]|uniref:uncharacterized protein LOC130561265 isoform X1 n=3 Tax=Triplophysa rosa TaxID=992332 RepID=UPI002545DCB9|nr:uncharacterized protein LOC130561265 isoform X1 [Triplophysa rosa]XP_057201464.1 uncharacterized protein LOC130561265 isoform X1 [Triplophysa rosa]